jgi:anti-sigma factor RsiW
MSPLPDECVRARAALADHLDDLLGPDVRARVSAHLATCRECGAAAQRATAEKALRETAWAVPSFSRRASDVLAAQRPPVAPRRPWLGHAAAFAAGVLVTLVASRGLHAGRHEPPPPAAPAAAPSSPEPEPSRAPDLLTYAPLRIR